MDFLEIPEEAKNSHPSSNDGATVAPLISTEKLMLVVYTGEVSQ